MTTISTYQRALITVAVMVAAMMQVLDTTIVNVALPHMEGSLGTTPDAITWVLTSYLVASAIFMTLTGYFTDKIGQKNYLLVSIGGFVIASVLCGFSENITQIVVFRLLQGIFGASLVPLSQAILADIFPPEDRTKAMAIWGVGVMVGPILGPTLGGYLTDIASWRWTFYINVPIGIFCFLLTWQVLPEVPKKERSMDWFGFGLLSMAIGALQYFLDRGNGDDWFNSRGICIAGFLAVMSFLGFLLYNTSENKQKKVFDLSIFKDRNFTLSSILLALFGLGLYGTMVTLPLMLEGLFHYPVLTTGLMMAPRGVSSMISMMLVSKWMKIYDSRVLLCIGIVLTSAGMSIGLLYNAQMGVWWIVAPVILQGFGLGMIFVPLSATAFYSLAPHLRTEAAGLFSLLRTIGSSVGISIVATLLSRGNQIHWNQLGGNITLYNPDVQHYLASLHLSPTSPLGVRLLARVVGENAYMMSFIDVYAFVTVSTLAMIPLVFFLKKPTTKVEDTIILE